MVKTVREGRRVRLTRAERGSSFQLRKEVVITNRLPKRAAFEPPKVKRLPPEYEDQVERAPDGSTPVRGEPGLHRSRRAGKSSAKIKARRSCHSTQEK